MLLLDIARRYHEYGMSQAAIAQATGYSRPTVGRLLAEAKVNGIVRIQITHPLERVIELETTIRNRFGVEHVRVAPTSAQRDGIAEVAQACATLLDVVLEPGAELGVSNGRIHTALLDHAHPRRDHDVGVVQLVGGIEGPTRLLDTPELCRRLARLYGGTADVLAAPLLAPSERAARDLVRSPAVARTLAHGADVDVAVIGIGAGFRYPANVFGGLVTPEAVRTLHRRGAVGHILGRFVDANGATVPTTLDRRVIGLELDALHRIPMVVAVAAGAQKAEAIAAALRGGYVDALVVDITAAQALAHLPERPRLVDA